MKYTNDCTDDIYKLTSDIGLFIDEDETPYADIEINGFRYTYPLSSSSFSKWLRREYYLKNNTVPKSIDINEAIHLIKTHAEFSGVKHSVFLRTAKYKDEHYVDLGGDTSQSVVISASRYEVIDNSPVRFIRPNTQRSLPIPDFEGDLDDLKSILNVSDNDWFLVLSYVLYSLTTQRDYPVLLITGPHGSAKSTCSRFIKSLIDPTKAPLTDLPRDERNMATTALNRWLLVFDNVSVIKPNQSDVICKVSTGMGFSTRTLHTTLDETVVEFARPQIITSINHVVSKGDLASRTLSISLPAITDKQRMTQEELTSTLDNSRPGIFGALIVALHETLKVLPETKPEKLPRMSDYGRFALAVEQALEFPKGTFWKAFNASQTKSTDSIVESSSVAIAISEFIKRKNTWEGTSTELLNQLDERIPLNASRCKDWPKTGGYLTQQLNRLEPDLRKIGVVYESKRTSNKRKISLQWSPVIDVSQPSSLSQSLESNYTNGLSVSDTNDSNDIPLQSISMLSSLV